MPLRCRPPFRSGRGAAGSGPGCFAWGRPRPTTIRPQESRAGSARTYCSSRRRNRQGRTAGLNVGATSRCAASGRIRQSASAYVNLVGNWKLSHPSSLPWERISCLLPCGCGIVPEAPSGPTPSALMPGLMPPHTNARKCGNFLGKSTVKVARPSTGPAKNRRTVPDCPFTARWRRPASA